MSQKTTALPQLHSAADVAQALGCSEWWVKEQARRGRIPFTKPGGSYRFTAEHFAEIMRIFESRPTESSGAAVPVSLARGPTSAASPGGYSGGDRHLAEGKDPAQGATGPIEVHRSLIPAAARPSSRAAAPSTRESKLGYAENLGSYWRGRYKLARGKYATVRDADGDAIRFRSKAAAKKAADAEEAKLLAGTKKAPLSGPLLAPT